MLWRRIVVFAFIVLAIASLALRVWLGNDNDSEDRRAAALPEPAEYRRIVSMAPNITEILFVLGLGERVVGVTKFCDFPEEASRRTSIGGLVDPDYEAVFGLRPDLVIVLPEHGREIEDDLRRLGLRTLRVSNRGVEDILESILTIGHTCRVGDAAGALVASLRVRVEAVRQKARGQRNRGQRNRGLPRPRVLICVGREVGSGKVESAYVAARGTYFDEIIELAGGENALPQSVVRYPVLSAEGLLGLDPDLIIDLASDVEKGNVDVADVAADWDAHPELRAVRDGRIHVFTADYVSVPGPRFATFLEDCLAVIHPRVSERERD